ncbi:MAG: DUF1294 domain-containing protein [Oscillospiraceae bacterium]|nr:DUF1294 domain-containing protein [Oscillospiraceae bacterium]
MKYLMAYLFLVNAAGLLLMLADKKKALKKAWRISEATLLGVAAIGGSLGALIGMRVFRHKTRHLRFSLGLPLLLAMHTILLCFLLTKL